MGVQEFLKDLSNSFYLVILIVIFVFILVYTNQTITYMVVPSAIDPNFTIQANHIIKTSSLYKKYNLREVNKDADITIYLTPRKDLDKWHKDKKFYPDGKEIRYSMTWQGKKHKPKIYIDDQNWLNGVKESELSLQDYRQYVILHELMHGLGYGHQECNQETANNGTCPIMYQSTVGCPDGFKCGKTPIEADFTKKLNERYIR